MRIALLLAVASAAYGQSPAFEVASIKPYERPEGQTWTRMGCSGGPGSKEPGRWTCESMGVAHLFQQAYELKPYQITGVDPIRGDRFNIIAKLPEGATKEEFLRMQQQLLAERFGVKFHREQKEMPVYELVVGKNGHKLTESGPESSEAVPPMPNSALTSGADGFPEVPPGRSGTAGMNGKTTSRMVRGTMATLASSLSRQVGRPVIDKTGLTGRYDYVLKFIMRAGISPPSPGPDGALPADPEGPSMAAAIQEQLGLRLESAKGMVEIYVIDSVAKRPNRELRQSHLKIDTNGCAASLLS